MTPEVRSHRILAAIRVTSTLQKHLVATDNRLRAIETDELGTATKAYREIVRDADERRDSLTPEDSHAILPQICDGLRARDAIDDANNIARKNRANERKRVKEAYEELHKPAPVESAQASLPFGDEPPASDTVAATGLEWFTADTRAVVYTALLHSDGSLDSAQADLLADLASINLDRIDFVLDAADAIVDSDEGDPLDDDQVDELDGIVGSDTAMKLISVRAPWAQLLVLGFKDVENRGWKTDYRGPVAIHATKTGHTFADSKEILDNLVASRLITEAQAEEVADRIDSDRGKIIGVVDITDCVEASESTSPWAMPEEDGSGYALEVDNARTVEPIAIPRGVQGKMRDLEPEIAAQLRRPSSTSFGATTATRNDAELPI